MKWERLLSTRRLSALNNASNFIQKLESQARSEFERDHDRIVFSSAFRRLQDKTQVFPLAGSDYVRTRLTHSLEVSCVGRSLGNLLGRHLESKGQLPSDRNPSDLGAIVAAACLAHDIGNPPFGHAGESAIQEWFKRNTQLSLFDFLSCEEIKELQAFEGNAQGLRLLMRLENGSTSSSLDLTCAVLGTYTKYPSTFASTDTSLSHRKKHGINIDDVSFFEKIASDLGLMREANEKGAWKRHPLAYLVEAADDICYCIVDLEDGFRMNRVDYTTARDLLVCLADEPSENIYRDRNNLEFHTQLREIAHLRAKAIHKLTLAANDVFVKNYDAIMSGEFTSTLIKKSVHVDDVDNIMKLSRQKIYVSPDVLEVELAGYEVLGGLLSLFVPAVLDPNTHRNKKLRALIPQHLIPTDSSSTYQDILGVTDFVSGMTDSYAIALYRRLKGIELPR
jgi:dGTPase